MPVSNYAPILHQPFQSQRALATKERQKKVKSQTEKKYILRNIICATVVNDIFLGKGKKNNGQIALIMKDYKVSFQSTEQFSSDKQDFLNFNFQGA